MNQYAILANPGHNRVYFEASKKLSISELALGLEKISSKCSEINEEYIANIFYITFKSESCLDEYDITIISKLSFFYAIFECFYFAKSHQIFVHINFQE